MSSNYGPVEEASQLIGQLSAMLGHAFGQSGDAFRSLLDEDQDNYLWACSNLAERLKVIINDLSMQPTKQTVDPSSLPSR